MKELLKLSGKDLLANERVNIILRGMDIDLYKMCETFPPQAMPVKVRKSLKEVAFETRNASVDAAIAGANNRWNHFLGRIHGNDDTYSLLLSDEKQWIVAAVLAREAQQRPADEFSPDIW